MWNVPKIRETLKYVNVNHLLLACGRLNFQHGTIFLAKAKTNFLKVSDGGGEGGEIFGPLGLLRVSSPLHGRFDDGVNNL